ncbi:hypothetical protein VNO77_07800 [Canavalia gladiata]|uniref:Uncharacterized protein n=1 Tax=Canavalia gladiata TaxID=3824 RepID=A0AAN9M8W4_CANGL
MRSIKELDMVNVKACYAPIFLPLPHVRSASGGSELLLPLENILIYWPIECCKVDLLEFLILETYEPWLVRLYVQGNSQHGSLFSSLDDGNSIDSDHYRNGRAPLPEERVNGQTCLQNLYDALHFDLPKARESMCIRNKGHWSLCKRGAYFDSKSMLEYFGIFLNCIIGAREGHHAARSYVPVQLACKSCIQKHDIKSNLEH